MKKITLRVRIVAGLAALIAFGLAFSTTLPAFAAGYIRISGEGSSWAGNAYAQWLADVKSQGVTVDYNPNGSSVGRDDFAKGLADFADSEIPYTGDASDPQDTTKPPFGYGMLPIVAGGTAFMYNLKVNGQQFRSLKLSQAAIAGIFSGEITRWNDPLIAADNKGVALPAQQITVVVRSDGSGATAQFKLWMLRQFPSQYAHLVQTTDPGASPKSASSYFPVDNLKNFIAQNGSTGVTTYTTNTPYTIDYDEYSYAQQVGFPVAQVKNAAGFYTVPDQYAVAVALTHAGINVNPRDPNYLSQDLSQVYQYKDPRTYPMSMYTYMIVPTQTEGNFTTSKGATLAHFNQYALCEGQRKMGNLGYSPLPMNLVLAAMEQVRRVPGIDAATVASLNATEKGVITGSSNTCNNPTFKPGDSVSHNVLVDTAPFPAGCTAACQGPWKLASAGNAISGPSGAGSGAANGGGSGGGTTGGGSNGGNAASTPTPTPTATAPAASGTGKQTCDPDTGVCTSTSQDAAASNLKAVPTVISGQNGWANPQTLMIVIGFLVLAILIAPPIVSRVISRGNGTPGGRP